MHLAPTDEQQIVPTAARKFLAAEITRERRAAAKAGEQAEGGDHPPALLDE